MLDPTQLNQREGRTRRRRRYRPYMGEMPGNQPLGRGSGAMFIVLGLILALGIASLRIYLQSEKTEESITTVKVHVEQNMDSGQTIAPSVSKANNTVNTTTAASQNLRNATAGPIGNNKTDKSSCEPVQTEVKAIINNGLLPHLKTDPCSLGPSFHLEKGRYCVHTVIGITHTMREKKQQFIKTIQSLTNTLKDEPRKTVVVIALIADMDSNYVSNVTKYLAERFASHVESGLLELLVPPKAYYPDKNKFRDSTHRYNHIRFYLRSKKNLDLLYLLAFAQYRCDYYFMLEDDVIVKPNFFSTMMNFAFSMNKDQPAWIFIEYSRIGAIGKLFKSLEIRSFALYLQMFYKDMSIEWLLENYAADKACSIHRCAKNCQAKKMSIRPQYNSSLFQHVGTYSSLKGKHNTIKLSNNRAHLDLNYD